MRIAFFGGSFDPPHMGHLRVAHAAAERLHLDRVLLAPVALQPLKVGVRVPVPASYPDRLAMLQLLLDDDKAQTPAGQRHYVLEVSSLDAPRTNGEPNYTYDTLLRLRTQMKQEDKLFLLMGADSFLSMRSWHRAAELLLLVDSIVAARPGFRLDQLEEALPAGIWPVGALTALDGSLAQQFTSTDGQTTTLYLLPDMCEEASATEIRAGLAADTALSPGEQRELSPSVAAYIDRHRIYR